MKEDLISTMIQVGGVRDMNYTPNSLGYRALTNAIKYLKEYEDLLNKQRATEKAQEVIDDTQKL